MWIPSVGFLGVLGNLGTVIVVLRLQRRSNFHQSILALAIIDLLFVGLLIVDSFQLDLDLENQTYILLFPYFWNPLKNILLCCETYIIMSIATERFMAIRRPINFRTQDLDCSSWVHFYTFILPAIVMAGVINIPKFFEAKLVPVMIVDDSGQVRNNFPESS